MRGSLVFLAPVESFNERIPGLVAPVESLNEDPWYCWLLQSH